MRPLLFPDPPRTIPGYRALNIALRTAHLMAFGTLLGGHVFDVDHARLLPFLVTAIVTGAGLMALELASTCAWLFMGKGIAVLLKLLLLAMIPLFWDHRVSILLVSVAVASVGAHMPSRFRYFSFLPHRCGRLFRRDRSRADDARASRTEDPHGHPS